MPGVLASHVAFKVALRRACRFAFENRLFLRPLPWLEDVLIDALCACDEAALGVPEVGTEGGTTMEYCCCVSLGPRLCFRSFRTAEEA